MSVLCIGRFVCFRPASALRSSSSLINPFWRLIKITSQSTLYHYLLARTLLCLNHSSRHVFPPRTHQSAPANSAPSRRKERTQTPCTPSSSSNRAEIANNFLYTRQGRPRADSNHPTSYSPYIPRHHSSRSLRPSSPIQHNTQRSQKE